MVTAEGANQSRSGTVTDKAGNTATKTVSGIQIDRTDPTVADPDLLAQPGDRLGQRKRGAHRALGVVLARHGLIGHRADRVADLIRMEVADTLMRKIKDPRVRSVTVTSTVGGVTLFLGRTLGG